MPEFRTLPNPMADPYAGQASKMIGELLSNIGQIKRLRQQRSQTDAALDIIKDPNLSPEQKRMGIIEVAQSGGDVLRNMLARQYMTDLFMPETERRYKETQIESTKALSEYRQGRAEYYRQGGSRKNDLTQTMDEIKYWSTEMNKSGGQYFHPNAEEGSGFTKVPKDKAGYDFAKQNFDKAIKQYKQMTEPLKPNAPAQTGISGVDYSSSWKQTPMIDTGTVRGLPEQKATVAPTVATGDTKAIEDEFAGYMDKLDEESKAELRQILEGGDRQQINAALQMLRKKYGNIR